MGRCHLFEEARGDRVLVIHQNSRAADELRRAGHDRRAAILSAESVCEGVRRLLSETVSLIVIDAALLRLPPGQHAALFDRVAPGVPVVVTVGPDASFDARVRLELAGFIVASGPAVAQDLRDNLEDWSPAGSRNV